MPTALFSHPDCRRHDMGSGHPECPQRLDAIFDRFRATGLDAVLAPHEAPLASPAALARAHSAAYVQEVNAALAAVATSGQPRSLDPDTTACPATAKAALRAAGAAIAATDAVLDGTATNAFCAVRPPGHHATRDAVMGFCFFNNVAVAARHALDVRGLQRVAIVDFDVHHGNGTEDIVAGDERILMVSIFQSRLYPFSGDTPLDPTSVNLPLRAGATGDTVRALVQSHWLPALDAFAPQMIFISAGFDAHREDPLGQLALVEADYAWITQQLMAVAQRHAQGRIVSCLEGGYALSALGRSVEAHVRALAGLGPD